MRTLVASLVCALAACAETPPAQFNRGDAAAIPDASITDASLFGDLVIVPRDVPNGGDLGMRFSACERVDLLFVIDNSGSMGDNQRSLVASFDGFMRGVRSRLSWVQSYHIGVVTSDDVYSNPAPCTGIGSLVTRTSGPQSSAMTCTPFASGANYLDEREPDLAAKFRCIGQVGTGGSDNERPMRALLNAVNPRNSAAGACNAGFARRDSLLVVVVITDEDDVAKPCEGIGCMPGGSGGTADDWYREIVMHRSGLAQNIVPLVLVGRRPDNPCGAQVNSRILGFSRRFGANGFVGDVCMSRYDEFFEGALAVIQNACERFVAPP